MGDVEVGFSNVFAGAVQYGIDGSLHVGVVFLYVVLEAENAGGVGGWVESDGGRCCLWGGEWRVRGCVDVVMVEGVMDDVR